MTGTRLEGRSFDVLADARRATSRLLDAAPREDRFGHAAGIPAAQAEDPSFLYVPGRLVIEVSGRPGPTGLLVGGGADREVTCGRLSLVRHARSALTEVTGA
jgi:hypothetical protein